MEGVKAKKWEGVQEVVYYVSALLCLFPRFSFPFPGPMCDYLFSFLSVPRLFSFDVLGFLLSCTAFEGYRTGWRD